MPVLLLAALALFAAALIVYSQTWAFTGDEGFHLLAAQLIDRGRRPYLDFLFPQTPLNAYWNAAWMRAFGQSWRVPHAVSAVAVAAAILLAAHFVLTRYPAGRWRTAAAFTVLIAGGLNVMVVEFGPLAQAYGTCLLLTVGAFRLAVASVERESPWASFGAALCASAAAACSLLTAPAIVVLLAWMLFYNRTGSRLAKLLAFAAGVIPPWIPAAILFLQSPRNVLFNLFEYHLSYRHLYWPETTAHDVEVLTDWIDCGQALLLALLTGAGLLFIRNRSGWERARRAEFYLCAWLIAGIGLEAATAHPTFQRYFVLIVPFAAILAAIGLSASATAFYRADRPAPAVALLACLFALGLGRSIYQRVENIHTWPEYEEMAREVDKVTPADAPLYADEETYFLTRRQPPPGLEFGYSHLLHLPAPQSAQLHVIPDTELSKMFAAGAFATTFTCDEDNIDDFHLGEIYAHRKDVNDCYLFWGKKGK